jgi:hypothetical protein
MTESKWMREFWRRLERSVVLVEPFWLVNNNASGRKRWRAIARAKERSLRGPFELKLTSRPVFQFDGPCYHGAIPMGDKP